MKIAFFTETFLPKVDGIVTRLTKTVRHLVEAGDEVVVFCPEGAPSHYMGAKVVGVPAMPLPLYPKLKLALPRPAVSEAIDAFQPDLVHVVNPAVLGLGAASGWLEQRHSADCQLPHPPAQVFGALRHGDAGAPAVGIAQSCPQSSGAQPLHLHRDGSRAERQRNSTHRLWQRGVDTDLFRPELRNDAMRKRLLGEHDDRGALLVYVGRLSAEKQIERIKPVLNALPDARLALVGDGPHRQQLEKHFEGTATTFVGYLAGEELASAYASGDAFLFPSSTETLGLVLLEAMAPAARWWAPAAGGIPDIISDGTNGCLYEPDGADGGAASLIEATRKLLGNDIERQGLRNTARSEAERWGWAGATEQLRGYYRQVLKPISPRQPEACALISFLRMPGQKHLFGHRQGMH